MSASIAESLKEVNRLARCGSGAEGKLHDDGAVFHPGDRNAVIEFADVAERSGCETGERSRWKKVANFHWGDFGNQSGEISEERIFDKPEAETFIVISP